MRQQTNPRPRRGRTNNRRPGPQRNQNFDSNGPSIRVRGNAYQVMEKYLAMARDATTTGDRIAAENYYQHAEHYFRILNANNGAEANANANANANGSGRDNQARDNQAKANGQHTGNGEEGKADPSNAQGNKAHDSKAGNAGAKDNKAGEAEVSEAKTTETSSSAGKKSAKSSEPPAAE